MEAVTLKDIRNDLKFVKQKLAKIELDVEEINEDLHQIRPEYLEKLKNIKKGQTHHFDTKEEFLDFLENEI